MSNVLTEVYERLYTEFGPQHWWPGESPFEIMVGAVLVQNTSWKNVEVAIENLIEAGVMDPQQLLRLPIEELQELIRPAGYFRLKAGRLRNLLRLIVEDYEGSVERMRSTNLEKLREDLLAVNGIGPETADSILLYALDLPTAVVDAYTHRVLNRHGWIDEDADYYRLKELVEDSMPREVALFNEFHALMVRVGRLHCRKTPKCETCPLFDMLPDGQIVGRG